MGEEGGGGVARGEFGERKPAREGPARGGGRGVGRGSAEAPGRRARRAREASVGGFRGDNRTFSSDASASSRVSVTVRVETDPQKNRGNPLIGSPEVKVSPTHLDLTGGEMTSTGPTFPIVSVMQSKNGNVVVNIQENMQNPFAPEGGGIQSNLDFTVNQNATRASVSGTISGSPAFEANFSINGGQWGTEPEYPSAERTEGSQFVHPGATAIEPDLSVSSAEEAMRGDERVKPSLIFLLCIGVAWALFEIWLYLSLGWISGEVVSRAYALLYWFGMLCGPLALVAGSALLLLKYPPMLGRMLVGIGCLALTAFALYNSFVGLRRGPLDPPPAYLFHMILLAAMLATNLVGVAVFRHWGSARLGQDKKEGH